MYWCIMSFQILYKNWLCNWSRLQRSGERVKHKPASSTALDVKWKHRLGRIGVYILWIGITCSGETSLRSEGKKREGWDWMEAGRRVRVEEDEWKRRREKKQWEWRGWPRERWPVANALENSFLSRGSSRGHMAPVKRLPRKCNTASQTCSLIPIYRITCTVWRWLVIWRRLSFWGQPHFRFSKTIAVNNRITQCLANLSAAWSGREYYACGYF